MAPTLNGPLTVTLFQGAPGPLNLIFAKQFKWAPNNSTDLGGQGPLI